MPYIKSIDRTILDNCYVGFCQPATPGELNYVITRICENYLSNKGLSYQHINDIVGALECAKQEYYRRVVAPYEDQKIKENGDVFV